MTTDCERPQWWQRNCTSVHCSVTQSDSFNNDDNNINNAWWCLWCCHHCRAIARVHPIHLMNVERRQVAADPRPSQTTWAVRESTPIHRHLLLLLNPKTDTHFTVLQRVEGWVNLVGWLHTEMVYLPTYNHPPCYYTHRGQRVTTKPHRYPLCVLSRVNKRCQTQQISPHAPLQGAATWQTKQHNLTVMNIVTMSCPMPHCRVLPPGELNSIISR